MYMKIVNIVAVALVLGICACSNDDTVNGNETNQPEENEQVNETNERQDISLTSVEQQMASCGNDFAFSLYREAAGDKGQAISPLSVIYALGLLNNGAVGETQKQISDVLGYGDTAAANLFCQKMLTASPAMDKLTKVTIANTIFMNKGYGLQADFLKTAAGYYDVQPTTRDFKDGKTLDAINQWASDHTEKMIDKVLDADSFDPSAISYLLNAIYFKGAWSEKFDKQATVEEPFDGGEKVPMMHQQHTFDYTQTADCQALRLPYGNNAYRMTILLPSAGKTVGDVMKGMTAESWKKLQDGMPAQLVDVKLPRFETQSDIDMKEILTAMGITKAFTASADFSRFCNAPAFISTMKHVVHIKVDEEGTEGAAVTNTGFVSSAGNDVKAIDFHANRPFVYVISEQSTGVIFFIGTFAGK